MAARYCLPGMIARGKPRLPSVKPASAATGMGHRRIMQNALFDQKPHVQARIFQHEAEAAKHRPLEIPPLVACSFMADIR
jgi:hypothetical protein